jgi:superfamily I DNA/RNA helicase
MLTEEQAAVVEAARSGQNLKVVAFAGVGKTFTLKAVAQALRGKKILYLTFSRALASEAREKFRGLADAMTNHALAFHKTGKRFAEKGRLKGSLYLARKKLIEDLPEADTLFEWKFRDREEAIFAILAVVNQFIQSDSDEVGPEHVPEVLRQGVRALGDSGEEFVSAIVPLAQRVWDLLSDYEAPYPVSHDLYLKLYQLSHPELPYDVILFDEAQDANPAMLGILLPQPSQRIFAGDPHQQIYAWRGAVNAMDRLDGLELPLSRSFRFNEEIAEEASEILRVFKGETRRIRGTPNTAKDSSVVILSRSNAGALQEVLEFLKEGYRVALVNKVEELADALLAAYRLYRDLPPRHPEFSLFRSWEHMLLMIEKFPFIATQYQPFQKLVEQYKDDIPRIVDHLRSALVKEDQADVVVSTAHRAKGREWDGVKLATDFSGVTMAQLIPDRNCVLLYPEEVNLVYVAFTRARVALEKGAFQHSLERQKQLVLSYPCCLDVVDPFTDHTLGQEKKTDNQEKNPGRGRRSVWAKIFGSTKD